MPSEFVPLKDEAVRFLRTVSLAKIHETLRDAKVCEGWRYFDDEGCLVDMDLDEDERGHIETAQLHALGGYAVGAVDWHRCPFGTPDEWSAIFHGVSGSVNVGCFRDSALTDAERAVEDAVVAAGWRVPWRGDEQR